VNLPASQFRQKQLRRILSKKFRLSRDDAASAMEPVHEATSQIIEHDLKVIDIFRDTYDDNIFACAVAAKTEYLVTGDADLPEIKIYKQVV
jgi:predicted nucleic acid-binding protein